MNAATPAHGRTVLSARGAMLVLLVGFLMLSAFYPARQYVQQRGRVAALRTLEAQQAQEAEALRAQIARLRQSAEIARLARTELGMVRPGEAAFAVVGGGGATKPAPDLDPVQDLAPAGTAPSWTSRWLGSLLDAMRSALR